MAFEVLVRARGPDDLSELPSPVHSGPAWVVDDDADSIAGTRNAIDTTTVPRRRVGVLVTRTADKACRTGIPRR
jgi:hypothetical protein